METAGVLDTRPTEGAGRWGQKERLCISCARMARGWGTHCSRDSRWGSATFSGGKTHRLIIGQLDGHAAGVKRVELHPSGSWCNDIRNVEISVLV